MVNRGYVVVDENCRTINVMPGATWFLSIRAALAGIQALNESNGDSNEFWRIIQRQKTMGLS